MKYMFIDVADISPVRPATDFSGAMIERLADSILENGGLVRPLVLRQKGPGKYEVADGHMEYWAAVRARKKDPRRGETINAFVVEQKSAEAAARQLSIVSGLKQDVSAPAAGREEPRETAEFKRIEAAIAESVRSDVKDELSKLVPLIDSGFARLGSVVLEKLSALEEAFFGKKTTSNEQVLPEEPFTRAKLNKTTVPILRQIIKNLNIPTRGLKLKNELIDAILHFFGEEQNGKPEQ